MTIEHLNNQIYQVIDEATELVVFRGSHEECLITMYVEEECRLREEFLQLMSQIHVPLVKWQIQFLGARSRKLKSVFMVINQGLAYEETSQFCKGFESLPGYAKNIGWSFLALGWVFEVQIFIFDSTYPVVGLLKEYTRYG